MNYSRLLAQTIKHKIFLWMKMVQARRGITPTSSKIKARTLDLGTAACLCSTKHTHTHKYLFGCNEEKSAVSQYKEK